MADVNAREILLLGVLRPLMRELATKGKMVVERPAMETLQQAGTAQLGAPLVGARLTGPAQDYETNLHKAKSLATQDPKVVAQVVKNWVVNDG